MTISTEAVESSNEVLTELSRFAGESLAILQMG